MCSVLTSLASAILYSVLYNLPSPASAILYSVLYNLPSPASAILYSVLYNLPSLASAILYSVLYNLPSLASAILYSVLYNLPSLASAILCSVLYWEGTPRLQPFSVQFWIPSLASAILCSVLYTLSGFSHSLSVLYTLSGFSLSLFSTVYPLWLQPFFVQSCIPSLASAFLCSVLYTLSDFSCLIVFCCDCVTLLTEHRSLNDRVFCAWQLGQMVARANVLLCPSACHTQFMSTPPPPPPYPLPPPPTPKSGRELGKPCFFTFKHDQHGGQTLFQDSLVHQFRLVWGHHLDMYTSHNTVCLRPREGQGCSGWGGGGWRCKVCKREIQTDNWFPMPCQPHRLYQGEERVAADRWRDTHMHPHTHTHTHTNHSFCSGSHNYSQGTNKTKHVFHATPSICQSCACTCTHACTHAHVHMHAHMHTCTHTHTHHNFCSEAHNYSQGTN